MLLSTTWSSLAWTVLALFYDSHGNEIRAEHAFLEAHRLNILAAVKKHEAEKAAERSSDLHSVSDQGSMLCLCFYLKNQFL